jgi:hypothetical protein
MIERYGFGGGGQHTYNITVVSAGHTHTILDNKIIDLFFTFYIHILYICLLHIFHLIHSRNVSTFSKERLQF